MSEDNNAVLIGLFSQYPRNKYPVTYSLAEPAIYYHVLESDFGLKGKKLKDRILEELKSIRSFQPAADAVDAIKTDEGNLLCIVREDGLSLINALENIKGFIGNRLPVIPAIDSADVSMMNLVRQSYQLEPHEVTVVIYVGVEFTRLIFMRGSHFYQFAPIIGEGYDSPNLQNTVYSRLLLEQDNLAIPQISRIVLAGQCRRIGFKEFLTQQLPDQEIDYLLAPNIDSSALPMEEQESISEFAVPIGAAMKVLLANNQNLYHVNLLPASVREGQRVFKLAWHGYLLMLLLFTSTFFFTWQVAKYSKQIKDLRDELTLKESQRAENITLATSIQALEEQLTRYQASMALYDSLVPGIGAVQQSADVAEPRRGGPELHLADGPFRRHGREHGPQRVRPLPHAHPAALDAVRERAARGGQRAGDPQGNSVQVPHQGSTADRGCRHRPESSEGVGPCPTKSVTA